MINKITVVGRLTDDVKVRKAGEKSVANYQIASQRPYKKDGEKPTDFISIVSWGNDADFLVRNSKKGAMIAITGRLETRSYDHPQHGIKIYVAEINTDEVQLLDWNENASSNQSNQYNQQQPYNPGGHQQPPQQTYNPAGGQYSQQQPNYSQQPPMGQQQPAYNQQPYQQQPPQQPPYQQQPPAPQQYNQQQPPAPQQYNQQQPPNQSNYRRVDEDPFAPGNNQVPNNLLVSDEDLPF